MSRHASPQGRASAIVIAALATLLFAAVVANASFGSDRSAAGGPLDPGDAQLIAGDLLPGPRHFAVDGMAILENHGPRKAVLDSVAIAKGSARISMLARAGDVNRLGQVWVATVDRWPPPGVNRSALRRVRGMVIPADSSRNPNREVQLLLKLHFPPKAGNYRLTGVTLRYHVGSRRYVLHIHDEVDECVTPNSKYNCPASW
jgi:hypothetical protein